MTKVLIIGAGKMGSAMAVELARQGVETTVWNRSADKLNSLRDSIESKNLHTSADLIGSVREADIIITVLTSGAIVEGIVLAPDFISACKPSAIVVDMSTSGVDTPHKLFKGLHNVGIRFVDAPVSGSIATIAAHQLLVMASGESEAIAEVTPVLMKFSKKVADLGPAGNGQVMKLAVNLIVHTLNLAIAESLALASTAGLSLEGAYDILEESVVAAPFLKYKRPAFTSDSTPVAMRVDTVLKDMNLICELATRLHLAPIGSPAVKEAYLQGVEQGLGDRDMASLLSLFITPKP